jgi:RNA polymerase sigma-70 factor (ECF subfamily)
MSTLSQTDINLIQKAARGDTEAFTYLFDQHYQQVYNYALWLGNDPDLAEDVTQETFIRAHHSIAKLKPPFNVRAWLYRLARNLFIDHRRARRPTDPLDTDSSLKAATPDPEGQLLWKELSNPVRTALQKLTPNHREALVLREVDGLGYIAIAEIMGVSVDNVKVLLHRARNNFKDNYSQRLLLEDSLPPCDVLHELLDAARDKQLSPEEDAYVRAHIKDCPTCQQRKRELAALVLLFGAQPHLGPAPRLRLTILDKVHHKPGTGSNKNWLQIGGVAGGAAIIVVIAWYMLSGGTPNGGFNIFGLSQTTTPPALVSTPGNQPPPPAPPSQPSATPAMCEAGWLPETDCTCCGSTLVCADGSIGEFNPVCTGGGEQQCECACVDARCLRRRNTCAPYDFCTP